MSHKFALYVINNNKSLDSFIMESWSNMKNIDDAYIQWIEYSLLMNVREMASLQYECTHIADWLEPATNMLIQVILKTVVDGNHGQSFDFYKVNYFHL